MITLEKALKELEIKYSEDMLEKFDGYMEGILEWNEKVNLTAIRDREEFVEKHYIDSVICSNFKEFENAEDIIDVGTGGGFPGVPLAILNPDKHFVLMDSLNKRLKIVNQLCLENSIMNTEVLHSRAEEAGRNKKYREKFDICISRAVANLAVLSEFCLPFVKPGGYFLSYKGPDCDDEIKEAAKAIKVLGGKIEDVKEASYSGSELKHKIICIKKISNTPAKFPRKAGTPAKTPIK